MKYYLFQGDPFQIQENRWEVLKSVEPSVVELTLEDYEKRMGIIPTGRKDKKSKNVRRAVGADSKAKTSAPVLLSRPDAIKALRKKGYEYKDIKSKTKEELNALL